MNVNISTQTNLDEIKEVINAAEDLEKKFVRLKENTVFVGPKELAKMLGCSLVVAREIFGRADFPVCDYSKEQKVFLPALWEYFMKPVKRGK